MSHIMLNGQAVEAQDAKVSVQDRGFRYGDGVFETISVHSGVPYRYDWHMERLARGLAAIRIAYDIAALKQQCKTLLSMHKLSDCLLRIQITRGPGSRGYLPQATSTPTTVIELLPLLPHADTPVSLWLSDIRRIPTNAMPGGIKLSQGMNSTLARMDADAHSCFDALQLTQEGHIAETSSANIFWIKNNTLFTPALSTGIVEGSIRAAVIALSPYKLQEVTAGIDELTAAESVFLTNTAWRVLPVKALQPAGVEWKTVAVAKQLGLLLTADIERHSREHKTLWQTA